MLSSLLLLGRTAAIQLDVDPYTTRVRSPINGTLACALGSSTRPSDRSIDHLTCPDPSIYTYIQCIMDEYAPEEESALKLRAVGRVQEGVRATVRACLIKYMCVSVVVVVMWRPCCPCPIASLESIDRPVVGGWHCVTDGGRMSVSIPLANHH